MTDPADKPETATGNSEAPGLPRWVKWSAVVVLALAVVLVVIMLLVGGNHGPGLHTGAVDVSLVAAFLVVGRRGVGLT